MATRGIEASVRLCDHHDCTGGGEQMQWCRSTCRTGRDRRLCRYAALKPHKVMWPAVRPDSTHGLAMGGGRALSLALGLLLATCCTALTTSGPECSVSQPPGHLPLPRCPASSKTLADGRAGELSQWEAFITTCKHIFQMSRGKVDKAPPLLSCRCHRRRTAGGLRGPFVPLDKGNCQHCC